MELTRKRMSDLISGDIPSHCAPEIDEAGEGIDDVNDGMEVEKKTDEDANFVPDDDDYVYVDEEEEEESEDGSSESDCQPVTAESVRQRAFKRPKIDPIDMQKYRKQVEESQGFDVDAVPGSTPFNCFIKPVPIKRKLCRKYYSGVVRWAIHRHNLWTKGQGVKLVTLLKVTSDTRPWHSSYFTFEGKDLADDKIKTYQTCVVSVPAVGRVLKLFRLKPPANQGGYQNLVLDERSQSGSANECEASKMPSDSDFSWTCKQTAFLDNAREAGISYFVQQFCKSWHQKDGQDQSSDDDQDPSIYDRVHKFSRIGLERYYREVEESKGYGVSLLPGMGLYDLITPIPQPWSESFRYRAQRCAQLATEYFNQKEGAQLKFLKIVKVNCKGTSTLFLYITFIAEDGVDGEAKIYQAMLLIIRGEQEVREVRVKPTRKDKSGRSGKP